MAYGKSINLFLIDGDANGRIKCTLANWTGVAYKIPRTELDLCKERKDLKQSGVYCLFGKTEDTDDDVVYIGQAGARKNSEGILNRLQEHKRSPGKDYWTEAIVFTTSNNSFGPTEISYLENRFCGLAKQAKRYVVKNENDPTPGNITEEKESELEEFIDNAKIIMGTLGHKVFIPIITPSAASVSATPAIAIPDAADEILYFNHSGVKATGKRTTEGFVVLKGSQITSKLTKSCPEPTLRNRKKYANKIDENFCLMEDILFSSPSSAASFIGGASLSGNATWCNAEGITLKNLEQN